MAEQQDPRQVTTGDTVQVHYTGTVDSGQTFDSSVGREPLSFTVGTGQVIAGFDAAVDGLAIGESRTVRIEPADAYGEHDPRFVVGVPLEQAPDGLTPGTPVQLGDRPAVVVEVTDEQVVVDANHPLAGEALTFEIELVSIS